MAKFKYDDIFTEDDKKVIRNDYVENFLSIREILQKYNIKSKSWLCDHVLKGFTRNNSEAVKIAHKIKPECFKHTEESKQKIREKRLKYLKEHPEDTAWRKRNEPSYPEKVFLNFLKEYGYDKKFLIEREKSVFPFYIDFAFINEMIAVEIDGSQHETNPERKQKDIEKDALLQSKGWKVLRFTEHIVKTDWTLIKEKLDKFINTNDITHEKVGIYKYESKNKKKTRKINQKTHRNGLTEKMIESAYKQRKVKDRPLYDELIEMLKYSTYTAIGRKYGVSDNTIRKWIKIYEKHMRLSSNG